MPRRVITEEDLKDAPSSTTSPDASVGSEVAGPVEHTAVMPRQPAAPPVGPPGEPPAVATMPAPSGRGRDRTTVAAAIAAAVALAIAIGLAGFFIGHNAFGGRYNGNT